MTATLANDTEVRLGDLLTVAGAVRKSGLSSTTLHYHIANGLIPVYRLGPLVVMRREDLDRFLAESVITNPGPGRPRRRLVSYADARAIELANGLALEREG